MAIRAPSTNDKRPDAIRASIERPDSVRGAMPRTRLVQMPVAVDVAPAQPHAKLREHIKGDIYLFIYRVRHAYDAYAWLDNIRYCTVFARGKHFQDAERIAINCVHQHGWRILKTDTATAFAADRFTDAGTDAAHVANLCDFGVSFRLNR